jgi:ribosomal protein S27E
MGAPIFALPLDRRTRQIPSRRSVPGLGKTYLVVKCQRCGNVMAILSSKRFTCRFCGGENELAEAPVLFTTDDARKAREMVASIKERMREGS